MWQVAVVVALVALGSCHRAPRCQPGARVGCECDPHWAVGIRECREDGTPGPCECTKGESPEERQRRERQDRIDELARKIETLERHIRDAETDRERAALKPMLEHARKRLDRETKPRPERKEYREDFFKDRPECIDNPMSESCK